MDYCVLLKDSHNNSLGHFCSDQISCLNQLSGKQNANYPRGLVRARFRRGFWIMLVRRRRLPIWPGWCNVAWYRISGYSPRLSARTGLRCGLCIISRFIDQDDAMLHDTESARIVRVLFARALMWIDGCKCNIFCFISNSLNPIKRLSTIFNRLEFRNNDEVAYF